MSGDFLLLVGVLVTAVVGGSGIAGAIGGTFELSRRSRIRRRVEKSVALSGSFRARTPEHEALGHAIALDTLRLASLSVIQVRDRTKTYFSYVAAGSIAYFGVAAILVGVVAVTGTAPLLFLSKGPTPTADEILAQVLTVVGLALIVVAMGVTYPIKTERIRRHWVRLVLAGKSPEDATAEAFKPRPRRTKPRSSRARNGASDS